jgi:heterodisulfide reductase subunit B
LALAVAAHNLVLAQDVNLDLAIPCAACFNRLKSAQVALADPTVGVRVKDHLGIDLQRIVQVRPLLEVLMAFPGLPGLGERLRHPLTGLRTASYYGCLLVRPSDVTQFDDPEHPILLDQLLRTLGATPVEWSYATECCGGSLSISRPKVVQSLVTELVHHAREAGAQALVTACPMCQLNLESRQRDETGMMPIFYFTELIGLALGLREADRWFRCHLIDPLPALKRVGLA